MRILAIGITFCLVFYTVCVSNQNDYNSRSLAEEGEEIEKALKALDLIKSQNDYDAGIAAYKREHYAVAFSNFESRAMEGDPVAQFCLGFMYKNHGKIAVTNRDLTEVEREVKSREETEKWYTKAADQGYLPAQNNLGVMYVRRYEESDHENHQAREKALEWFRKAADQGYLPAQNNLGVIDHMRLKWWEQAASQGYAPSQRHLGYMYHEGDGVKQNYAEAVEWHTEAAKQGNPFAQHNLGICYKLGLGVEQDQKRAFRYFKKAAEHGYAGGEFQVAAAYLYSWGTDKNPEKAIKWYKKAAEQNHTGAQNNLAALYSEGEVIPKNPEMANRWMLRAAQQGNPIAQKNIADKFHIGKDKMPQDFAEAYYWYSLALKNKDLLNGTLYNKEFWNNKKLVADTNQARETVGNQLDKATKREIQAQIDNNWKPKILSGYGTGFYIDENHILTNAHVANKYFNEFRIPYRRVSLIIPEIPNHEVDLALLFDESGNPDVVATFRSQSVKVAEDIIVFGYPKSQDLSYAGNFTSGIVSGLSGTIELPQPGNRFRHTAPITPGNSGGPVFDKSGNVVGVNVSVLRSFRGIPLGIDSVDYFNMAQNINFAIKFKVIKDFIDNANLRDINYKVIEANRWINTEDKGVPREDIHHRAQKFTVPVVCWKNKEKEPLEVIEIGIDELKSLP